MFCFESCNGNTTKTLLTGSYGGYWWKSDLKKVKLAVNDVNLFNS